jgi:glucosamine--fructose-6-phosphate aminotransferase (isomerizing)
MNRTDEKYTRFALCREMLETPEVMRGFAASALASITAKLKGAETLLITGEGSSRIFPAKRARAAALRTPGPAGIPLTEGCTQALEYDLDNFAVLGASNSGRTKELVRLFGTLKAAGHSRLYGITANTGTPLEDASNAALVLNCGPEEAVAATKSVVEQAMAVQAVMAALNGTEFPDVSEGADAVEAALTAEVPKAFADAMAASRTIFFAGRNDGVAEELTLKTNEIVRKPSDYLEGTYAAHGIEEIMTADDVVILVDPFPEEEAKLKDTLADGVGVTIIAISDRETLFPTILVPAGGVWKEYILLAAGWNLLVEAGIAAGIDLDKPERARKVGNEVD